MSAFSLGITAQTNVTEKYITNGDFSHGIFKDNAPEGWTLALTSTGVQSKISLAEKGGGIIAGAQNHWQLWQSGGALTGKAYQTLNNLPLGRYKLTATIVPSYGGGKASLYFGGDSVEIVSGNNAVYELEALVSADVNEIGLSFHTTNGALIDIDDFKLFRYDFNDEDAVALLEDLHALCVKDTLSKNRQKWYNRDEMLAAFDAYHQTVSDSHTATTASRLLQQAHENFQQITSDYKNLREMASSLYSDMKKQKFAYVDSVTLIRRTILSYYYSTEDHYAWVKEHLVALDHISAVYDRYKATLAALRKAYTQLNATNYPGRTDFKPLLDNLLAFAYTATTTEQFDGRIDEIEQALDVYLKTRPSEWVTIKNGQLWHTDKGTTVQAHAPGFVRVGDIWYMCGEDRTQQWNPDVNLYSSIDLVNWKFEKKIVQNGVATPELGKSRMIERPKLLYNRKTGKFVVWCHYEAGNYGASEAACFECDSVNGSYKYVWSGRPLDIKSRDCNVFQDNDGTAYFISTTDENRHLGLFRLSDDYHSAVEHTQLFAWQSREAPAIVRIGNKYFMFSSACSGWDPNQCKLSYTTNLKTGWSGLSNIGNGIAYDTQAAAILEIKGTKTTTYLYVGDRWQDPGLYESKTIMFPISFNGNSCNFTYHERFDINFVTGEWRETPKEDLFLDKKNWKVIDYSSQEDNSGNAATNAIDGNVNTIWHTKYSGTVAAAPHHITIDLGANYNITGFIATPRMDNSTNGLIRKYQFMVSSDGSTWKLAQSGDWMPYCAEVSVNSDNVKYVKLICTEGTYASLAEFDLIGHSVATGTADITADDTNGQNIVARKYYRLNGTEIATPRKGLYIEQLILSDGSTRTVKKLF